MAGSLKLYIAGVATASAIALVIATLVFPPQEAIAIGPAPLGVWLGIAFWTLIALLAWALPVRMPTGMLVAVSIAPIVAAMYLGGPAVAGWVALIGSTEAREVRGKIPWYGTVANHASIVLPAIVGGVALMALTPEHHDPLILDFIAAFTGAGIEFALNQMLASILISLRTGLSLKTVLLKDASGYYTNLFALAPLAWLVARVYVSAGWWATLLFALPLYTSRLAYRQFVEMREMFTQTVDALAGAVDKRDVYTANHSRNVQKIAVDIGRVLKVTEPELQALEWGGLLHDIGKIGVRDDVLLKQGRLTREERMAMNAHPVLGAEIIAPVTKLAPELPIIRHHHEWYNGSGYPDRLIGDEIPRLARILHVADAFEAMTAARPYRMQPLSQEQALGELRKFAGIQFDPVVVDAFVRTPWVQGVSDPGRPSEPRPVPLLGQAAGQMTQAASLAPAPTAEPG